MRRNWLSLLGIVLLTLTVVEPLPAQQGPATPGPEHALLKKLAGTWDCSIKIADQVSKGSSTMESILGGMWLESDFKGEFEGFPFSGRGLDGYDQDKQKYISVWVDSMSSSVMVFEGSYDEASKTLTLLGSGKGPDGKPAKYKNTSTFVDDNRHIFKMYLVGADGNDNLMMTIEYTRKQ